MSGFGYVLMQASGDSDWYFIWCGSTSLTEAQSHYSTFDLELAAMSFAVTHLKDYLSGCLHFTILTDCKGLHKLEDIKIEEITSNRTLRCVETILSNNVTVSYIHSKHNRVADYFFCHLQGPPSVPGLLQVPTTFHFPYVKVPCIQK